MFFFFANQKNDPICGSETVIWSEPWYLWSVEPLITDGVSSLSTGGLAGETASDGADQTSRRKRSVFCLSLLCCFHCYGMVFGFCFILDFVSSFCCFDMLHYWFVYFNFDRLFVIYYCKFLTYKDIWTEQTSRRGRSVFFYCYLMLWVLILDCF